MAAFYTWLDFTLTLEMRVVIERLPLAAEHMTRQPRVSYAAAFDTYCPNMTVTERFTTFRYACLLAAASYDACPPRFKIRTGEGFYKI